MKQRWRKLFQYVGAAIVILGLTITGYFVPASGFGDYTSPNGDFVRGKTLWDWMELLIIPFVLALGAYYLNRSERKTEREIATDRQQEAALQAYLDRMAELLLEKELRTSENEEVRNVARIRTLTVLRRLDATRKGIVLKFLFEARLIEKKNPVVRLQGADLSEANLPNAHLSEVNLSFVKLDEADLSVSDLTGADLSYATLNGAILRHADLSGANFFYATLIRADLTGADLCGYNNQGSGDPMSYITSGSVNLLLANLRDANLTGAILKDAVASTEQIETASLLKGATMPDGTKHT